MTEEDVWRIGGFVGMVFLRGNTEPRARARPSLPTLCNHLTGLAHLPEQDKIFFMGAICVALGPRVRILSLPFRHQPPDASTGATRQTWRASPTPPSAAESLAGARATRRQVHRAPCACPASPRKPFAPRASASTGAQAARPRQLRRRLRTGRTRAGARIRWRRVRAATCTTACPHI